MNTDELKIRANAVTAAFNSLQAAEANVASAEKLLKDAIESRDAARRRFSGEKDRLDVCMGIQHPPCEAQPMPVPSMVPPTQPTPWGTR